MTEQTILMIEDDAAIRDGVKILLENAGYKVEEAENGADGLNRLNEDTDLVILDVMMPGMSGFETCEQIRAKSSVPVLFLTAKDQESDKLTGLNAGGDDYLVKPFSYAELLGRINALLRRRNIYDQVPDTSAASAGWVEIGKLRVNREFNQVFSGDVELDLTDIEYRLLLLFMEHPTKVFSVSELYEQVWQEPFVYTTSNTVMVYIRRLRKKIEADPQKPKLILTVWGKGYRFGQ